MLSSMKDVVFWDVMPCDCSKNRLLGRTYRLHYQGDNTLTTNVFIPSSLIHFTLMMEAIRSSD
jgi:chorismate-pyruvate lyase